MSRRPHEVPAPCLFEREYRVCRRPDVLVMPDIAHALIVSGRRKTYVTRIVRRTIIAAEDLQVLVTLGKQAIDRLFYKATFVVDHQADRNERFIVRRGHNAYRKKLDTPSITLSTDPGFMLECSGRVNTS